MNKINIYIIAIFSLLLIIFTSCEEEYQLGQLITPSNISISYTIEGVDEDNPYGDGSGSVSFSAVADDEITFNYIFGDGSDKEVSADGNITHVFAKNGVNTYTVTVVAVGTGGLSSSQSTQVEVYSSFSDDEAAEFLTGGSSKTWYWAADQIGHIGLGPNYYDSEGYHTWAYWYNAAAYEKTCMYDAEFVFTQTDDGVTFEQTAGVGYVPGAYADVLGVDGDDCYGEDVLSTIYGVKSVSFAPSNSIATEDGAYRGTSFTIGDGGFMCWYVGTSTYEIISVSDDVLEVRVEQDGTYAWYQTLTSTKPTESEELDVEYTNLIWSDEFDTDGTPDAANWTYDLGAGGWGNNELQTYTSNSENVSVADGILKITAKADGDSYTSARLKTQGLYEFTYGRVDVRAKLPEGGGTWPAIWMLGADYSTAGWPECGEIDIMEAIGNNPGYVQSAIHTPYSYGDTENMESTTVSDVSSEFHIYSVNWSEDQISFLIDDEIYYTYSPESKDDDNWPFNKDQFIILNVAMGGNLGGTVSDDFVESSMEIDYVRIYQ